jgi:hypothetical protein
MPLFAKKYSKCQSLNNLATLSLVVASWSPGREPAGTMLDN